MVAVIPLNMIFYVTITVVCFILILKTTYIGRAISAFIFGFMAIWLSDDILMSVDVWYTGEEIINGTVTTYNITHVIEAIPTPYNGILVLFNIGLALMSATLLYISYRGGKK